MPTPPDEMIARLADRRFGVVTRRGLRAAGLSDQVIDDRIAKRQLLRMHPGVYAVGHRRLTSKGLWIAAVLAGGPGAVLSHRSAADAWGLRPTSRRKIDITVAGNQARRSPSLDAHRCRLAVRDITELDGIPITTPVRTLLDLAEVVPRSHLDRAIERAVQLDLYDGFALNEVIARANGRRGLKHLKAALAALELDATRTHSELERRMLSLVANHGIPRPAVNARIADYEVDLVWRDHRVVVELDGYTFHRSPTAFEKDRRRDARLSALGYRVLRFTWSQVTSDPAFVASALTATLRAATPPALPRPTPKRAPAAAAR